MVPTQKSQLFKKFLIYIAMLMATYACANVLTLFSLNAWQILSGQGGWTPTDYDEYKTFSDIFAKFFLGALTARLVYLTTTHRVRNFILCALTIPASFILVILAFIAKPNLLYEITGSVFISTLGLFIGYGVNFLLHDLQERTK